MNMVNLFNLGTINKQVKPVVSGKEKAANKKEFEKVFQDFKKQAKATDSGPMNQRLPQGLNKLGHLVNNTAEVIQQEAKNSKETNAGPNPEKNVIDDSITKVNELASLLNQIQQSLQELSQNSSINEADSETEQTVVNQVSTLLDGLKGLSQELPVIQDILGDLQKFSLNSSMVQQSLVDESTKSADLTVTPELNIKAKMESSLEDITKAISNLTASFTDFQQTVKDLAKSNQENPLLQEVLAKLNDSESQIQPAMNLISKFPNMLPNLLNLKMKDQDVAVEVLPEEVNQMNFDGFKEVQAEVPKTANDQDPADIKLKLETATKAVSDKIGQKAGQESGVEGTEQYDPNDASFSSLIQNKQTDNLQQMQKLSQLQANATKGLGENVVDQLVQKASLMVKENFSEMKIQLTPHNLGKVDLQISIERGLVVAKFAAESQQVKELIESNLSNLKQHLANQGLKVDQLTVNVGQQGFEQSFGNAPQQANFKPSTKRVNPEDGEDYQGVLAEEVNEVTRRYYSDNEVDYIA